MWPFRTHKSGGLRDMFRGLTDWHSHILPGVDDGVSTMEESLAVLRRYEELGVCCVWLTPHVMEDIPNTTASLRQRFGELRAAYKGPVELRLASENMMDNLLLERLESNDFLPIGGKRDKLLVETSFFDPPMDMTDTLLRIRSKGYFPVLAHPERCFYMDKRHYRRLKEIGVRFQLNLFSLEGMYGKEVRRKAEMLRKLRYYDYTGSDLHSMEWLKGM